MDKKKYLTLAEVEQLAEGSRELPYGDRNAFMIGFAFRHALRNTELCSLKWSHLNLTEHHYLVHRAKGSKNTMHWLEEDEMYELKELAKQRAQKTNQTLKSVLESDEPVFLTRNGKQFTERGFHFMVKEAGKLAKFKFRAHPHMLRHAKGYHLVNSGVDIRLIADYMGHKNIANTMIYTAVDATRFRGLGKDLKLA